MNISRTAFAFATCLTLAGPVSADDEQGAEDKVVIFLANL